jgi:small subunit ribosomal protein S6
MRQYEICYILDPMLDDDQQSAIVNRFQTLVTTSGGEVQAVDKWERRRLAYEINGRREGIYVIMNFTAEPATESEVDRLIRLQEGVLRHLIVRPTEKQVQSALQRASDAERAAAAQADAPAAEETAAAEDTSATEAAPAAADTPEESAAAPAADETAPEEATSNEGDTDES